MRPVFAVLFSLATLALGFFSTALWAQESVRAVPVVQLVAAQTSDWHLTGVTTSRFDMPLSFRIRGKVLKRWVEVGDKVQKGQLLAQLEQEDLTLAVIQAKAKLGTAQADAKNALRELNRLKKLYQKKLVSQQALQRAQTSELGARQAVLAAKAGLSLAARQENYGQLRSPASGVLTQVDFNQAQVVNAGQVVVHLATGAHEVRVQLPSNRLAYPFQTAVAKGVDFQVCEAVLRAKSPVALTTSLQYEAFYTLKNCSQPLSLGSVVSLRFQGLMDKALKQVPISAIIVDKKGAAVWQVKHQQVRLASVKIVAVDSEMAYVHTQLPLGATLVSQGVHLLNQGQKVKVLR